MFESRVDRAAWVEVDLKVFDANIKAIKKRVGTVPIAGIIKADAYGHGAVQAATVLKNNGVTTFGIATVEEGIELRKAGFLYEEIIVLGLTAPELVDEVVHYGLAPVVDNLMTAELLSKSAERAGKDVRAYLAVDTGMGRIGYRYDNENALYEIKKMTELPRFTVYGLISHFAKADAFDKAYAEYQFSNYESFYRKLQKNGIKIQCRTFSNSAVVVDMDAAYYDLVRPGIILYGYYPSTEVERERVPVRPVMSVKAKIVNLKHVPAGTCISYGCIYITKKDSIIGTLPLGYADGFPRAYSKTGTVLVNGFEVPVAGNINMDQCMIDVTEAGCVNVGDEVVVIGRQGEREITADRIAEATGTIAHEILCGLGQRLPKKFII